MYCKNCGNSNKENSKFCEKCDTKIITNENSNKKSFEDGRYLKNLFTGRIGRLNFFLGHLFSLLPVFLITFLWGIISIISKTVNSSFNILNIIIPILIVVCVIFYFLIQFGLLIRRCHDINASGWFSLLTLIPYLGIIPALYFLFKKGNKDSNKYGTPPLDNRGFLSSVFNY